jgi:DNA-nicking Smr family endonuclease
MANKGRNIGEDDLSLWERFVEGINPLKKRDKPIALPSSLPKKSHREQGALKSLNPSPHVRDGVPSISQNKLDRKTLQKFQSGKMSIDGTIDLHGLSQDQAYHQLKGFLTQSFVSRKRCVLVVTGKGGRHKQEDVFSSIPDGQGVLKTRLPEWVSQLPLSEIVLRHDIAQQKHGGGGAFYIYLKKNK